MLCFTVINNLRLDFRLQTWMYLAVPVLLYASERILRLFRSGLYTVRLGKVSKQSELIRVML